MIVERNEFGDITWFDSNAETVAVFYNGRKGFYSTEVERGLVGYTIKLTNDMGTTSVHLQDKDEALDTINNHIERWDKIKKQRELTNDYCSKNPWTYSGT